MCPAPCKEDVTSQGTAGRDADPVEGARTLSGRGHTPFRALRDHTARLPHVS